MRPVRAVLVALCVVGITMPLLAQQPSWVGKTIFTKKPKIQIGHTDKDGKDVVDDFLDQVGYRVLADQAGWIKVKTVRGKTGWFSKKDAVVQEDAIDYFSKIIKQDPTDSTAFLKRGWAWQLKGNLEQALKDLDEAIRVHPTSSVLFHSRGTLWAEKKDYDKAIADYDEAIRLDAKDAFSFYARGNVWIIRNELANAISDLTEALDVEPNYVNAFSKRALAWAMKDEYAKAIKDYEKAIDLDAGDEGTHNNYAWLLATCPEAKFRDPKKAVEHAKKACELTHWKSATAMDTLAAACAANGQFKDAIDYEQQALKNGGLGKEEQKESEMRLALYKKGQPYHEEMKKEKKDNK